MYANNVIDLDDVIKTPLSCREATVNVLHFSNLNRNKYSGGSMTFRTAGTCSRAQTM